MVAAVKCCSTSEANVTGNENVYYESTSSLEN